MSDPKPRLHAKLRLPDGQRVVASEIWNTSLGGVFVERTPPLPFGMAVVCEFEPQGRGGRSIRCNGYVVWTTKQHPERASGKSGSAVRLADIGIADMRLLADYVGRDL